VTSEPKKALWEIEFYDLVAIERALKRVTPAQLAEVIYAMESEFALFGLEVFSLGIAKWLGDGLAEYRFRRSPDLLLRFFFCVRGGKIIVILSAYDKGRSNSKSRQQTEIVKAKKLMKKL